MQAQRAVLLGLVLDKAVGPRGGGQDKRHKEGKKDAFHGRDPAPGPGAIQ